MTTRSPLSVHVVLSRLNNCDEVSQSMCVCTGIRPAGIRSATRPALLLKCFVVAKASSLLLAGRIAITRAPLSFFEVFVAFQ